MKRIIALGTALLLMVSMAGCRRKQTQSTADTLPVDNLAAAQIRQAISLLIDRLMRHKGWVKPGDMKL